MHIEILVEDSSGKRLLEILIPRILGSHGHPHTWYLHAYKGIGRIPQGLRTRADPAKRILLEQLPRLLRGYGKTPGIDAVAIVLDADNRDCGEFLRELARLADACNPKPKTMFRLAIEEIEAWYLGDREALLSAYPRARRQVLDGYMQDSICGTWERIADAVIPEGARALGKGSAPLPGELKHEWAEKIGPFMDLERNVSPSFRKLREGLRQLVTGER